MPTDPEESELFEFEAKLDALDYQEKARQARTLYIATDALMERNLVHPLDTMIFVGQALCGLARELKGQRQHSDLRRTALRAYRLLNERVDSKKLNRLMIFDHLKRMIDREYESFEFIFQKTQNQPNV